MPDQARGILSPWIRTQRINAVLPYLRGNILDYGCGVGVLAGACQPDLYLGVDIDAASLAVTRARYPGFRFSDTIFPSDRFDTIVLLAVIEHLPSPEMTLRELRSVLNVNGRIALTTPHPLFHKVHRLGAIVGLFSIEAGRQHQALLNYRRMKALADSVDLQIETFRYFLGGANQLFVLSARS